MQNLIDVIPSEASPKLRRRVEGLGGWAAEQTSEATLLTTHNSELAALALDVLFHPRSRARTGACSRHPTTEADMDRAGIGRALVSQCKKWSCERQWMCVDTRLEDVLRYTECSPRFIGLAGYNPFDIAESLREIELAVAQHGFRGVYLHAASFRLPLTDPRMYPLFAKAAELAVPVLVQLPVALDLRPELGKVVADFPELALVFAHPCPQAEDLAAIAAECENVFFALDPAALAHFVDSWSALDLERDELDADLFSGMFQERCMWGSNGMAWPDALRAADSVLVAPPLSRPGLARQGGDFLEIRSNFLHRNAERVFALDQPPASRQPRSALSEILVAER